MANLALIKYYARLLQKGYDDTNIPPELMPEVQEELKKLDPIKVDPETQTPAEGETKNQED